MSHSAIRKVTTTGLASILKFWNDTRKVLLSHLPAPEALWAPTSLTESPDEARTLAGKSKELFGEDFYIEIQNHGLDIEEPILSNAPRLARELGVKLVATNDCHYISPNHSMPHNIMKYIPDATSTFSPDYKVLKYRTDQLFFKSAAEMIRAFKDFPEAIASTLEIAEKCNLTLDLKKNHMPEFPIPTDAGAASLEEYLDKLSKAGIERRYSSVTPEVLARLEHELQVIKKMGYAGYFLMVQDFISAAGSMGIRVGPGRGSRLAASFRTTLGITDVDPLYLRSPVRAIFEPGPCQHAGYRRGFRRQRTRPGDQLRQTEIYGKTLSQIITFGTLSTRAVLKDVGRVLGVPLSTIEPLTKQIPVFQGKRDLRLRKRWRASLS